jgi:cytochrome c biogenesis factor
MGNLAVGGGFAFAVWATMASVAGVWLGRGELIVSARRALVCAALAGAGATGLLVRALWTGDFALGYVASVTASNIPLPFVVAGLWAAPAGALLASAALVALCAAVAVWTWRASHADVSIACASAIVAGAFALAVAAHPFAAGTVMPPDGAGLIPPLQTEGMLVQPVLVLLALAALGVPAAIAVGAAVRAAPVGEWLPAMQLWTALSWAALTLAGAAGVWWAYEFTVTDAWINDPIRTGLVWPWLAASAGLIGGVLCGRGRAPAGAVLVPPVVAWIAGAWYLIIAPGGAVHGAGGGSAAIAQYGGAGLVVIGVAAGAALWTARAALRARLDPGASEPVDGMQRITLGLTLAGGLLMCGGMLGHAAQRVHDVLLGSGQSVAMHDPAGRPWRFTALGRSRFESQNRYVVASGIAMSRAGHAVGVVASEEHQFMNARGDDTFEPYLVPGILGDLGVEVRVRMSDAAGTDVVEYRIAFDPLVRWIWIGGAVFAFAGLAAAWPRERETGHDGAGFLLAADLRRMDT